MEIKYLKKLEHTHTIKKDTNVGITESEINSLESKMSIKLPQVFKEYLFLCGKSRNFLIDWNGAFKHLEYYQEEVQESMQNVNLHLKPFFVFATYGNDQALFFFLDEGDNPPVYQYAEDKFLKNEKEEYIYWKKTDSSFSDCIDGLIIHALKK